MGWASASGEQGLQNWIGVFKAQLLRTLCVILDNLCLFSSLICKRNFSAYFLGGCKDKKKKIP